MKNSLLLFRRNARLFLRDRAAVFFSLLSALIVLALYLLFIARMYVNGMTEANIPLDSGQMNAMIYNTVFVSVIILNSISVPLCALTAMMRDFESKKIDGILLAPVSKTELLISYFMSAFLISSAINCAAWIIGTVTVGLATGHFLSVGAIFAGLAITAIISLSSACVMSLVVTLVRSTSALNVIGGVAGTFFGFICGLYMPYSALGIGMKYVGSLFPFTHLAVWFKMVVLDDCFLKFSIPAEFHGAVYDESFSAVNVGFLGLDVPQWAALSACGLIAAATLLISVLTLGRRLAAAK